MFEAFRFSVLEHFFWGIPLRVNYKGVWFFLEGSPQKREVDPQKNMALGIILSLVLFVVACGI